MECDVDKVKGNESKSLTQMAQYMLPNSREKVLRWAWVGGGRATEEPAGPEDEAGSAERRSPTVSALIS